MFNPGVDESQVDMLLVFRTGCMNVVFLNSFVQSLLVSGRGERGSFRGVVLKVFVLWWYVFWDYCEEFVF